jgi:hypothetical protein
LKRCHIGEAIFDGLNRSDKKKATRVNTRLAVEITLVVDSQSRKFEPSSNLIPVGGMSTLLPMTRMRTSTTLISLHSKGTENPAPSLIYPFIGGEQRFNPRLIAGKAYTLLEED